ncbi:MAG: hypothetical protein DRN11_03450 [Thermoplasmata archaeon]|nr:MAG: hypothetical protein DRN11_03450 [Thermoplasmata archaeon]
MITTGLKKFDEYLNGGIPKGKSLLFQIEPGMEETDIAFHIMKENAEKVNTIYVSSVSSPKNVYKKMEEFNLEIKEKKFAVVDGYSSLIGAPSEEKYVVEEPHDIGSYEDVIFHALEDMGGDTLIVFDSLSNIMDLCNERTALEGIERINNEISKIGAYILFNFIAWPYKEAVLYKIKRMFNAIIYARKEGSLPLMEIKRVDWNGKIAKFYFKIFKPDGLRIYIPKIIVTGSFKAGKTTFLKSISKKFFPVERLGATTGVEYGIVDYKGYRADVFGIPGREGFAPLLDKFAGSSMGVIIVLDSTDESSIRIAKNLVEKFRNVPRVIVANKQDAINAKSMEEIKRMLFPYNGEIVKASAINGVGTMEAFEILADKILEELNVN